MSIRSLFGKKDKVSSTIPPIPQLPSVREMINDMENIKKNDPILSLAAIIEKKGRHSVVDSDINELMEALRKRRKSEEQSALSTNPSFRFPILKVPSFDKISASERRSSLETDSKLRKESRKGKLPPPPSGAKELERSLNYDKLKHFLTTCEHSQELISTLEPEFRKLENEIEEYSKTFDAEGESNSADSESESKLT